VSDAHPTYHKIQNPFKMDPETRTRSEEFGWTSDEFRFLRRNEWRLSEKIDGTNVRIMWDGAHITFNGKTDGAQMPGGLVQFLQGMFGTPEMLERFSVTFGTQPITIYGEGFGGKIQGGSKYSPTSIFAAFDVRIEEYWLKHPDFVASCESLGIPRVPVLLKPFDGGEIWTLDEAIDYARKGFSSNYARGELYVPAEGVIAKPTTELRTRLGERIVIKIKTLDFARQEAA
jgi:hypothetical protein